MRTLAARAWPSVSGSDSPLPRLLAIVRSMPLPDLTEQDYSDLAALVREAIEAEPYRAGPRIRKLRLWLAPPEPQPDKTAPYPPQIPTAQPSPPYPQLRGGPRRP